jgi:hypothetical protein
MLSFKNFLSEKAEKPYVYKFKHSKTHRSSVSPYWSGISRKRTRIGGMTYTVTFKGGKAKFTKRARTLIGKKRYK